MNVNDLNTFLGAEFGAMLKREERSDGCAYYWGDVKRTPASTRLLRVRQAPTGDVAEIKLAQSSIRQGSSVFLALPASVEQVAGALRVERILLEQGGMPTIVEQYAEQWDADPRKLLDGYAYQPALTRKLDALRPDELDRESFYEIVLWKLNRFPQIDQELLDSLKTLAILAPKAHRQAAPQLRALLTCPGIALPMASTVLRFINPAVFQIIDDRVFRVVQPGKPKYPTKPARVSDRYLNNSMAIYFDYLDALHAHACPTLPFVEADRILYELDIKLGNKIGD